MFCIKGETCARNKGLKWANILKTSMPSLSPSAPRREAVGKHLSCLPFPGWGLGFPAKPTRFLTGEGSGRFRAKCGVFPPCAVPCGCEHVLVLVLELSTLLAQAGEIPLAEPEMTLDGFSREWFVLIAPGKDREAWINHVHPPWQPCLGRSVYACTEIRCGSI